MRIPLIALILQGIPEQIAVVTLAFVIAKLQLKWKVIAIGGIGLAVTSYLLRLLPVAFGVHTILLISLLFLLLLKFGQGTLNISLIASLISFLVLILAETACLCALMPVFGVTTERLLTMPTTRILITLPQVVVIFIIAFIIAKFRSRGNSK
ncbi:MAG: hypothetical protein WCR27_09305 [Eubacteriales bacterium]